MDVRDGLLFFSSAIGDHIVDTLPAMYTGGIIDGGQEIAMEWTYENMVSLTQYGLPVPSTIMAEYKYPKLHGLYDPFPHQEQIAEFLTLNHRAFCFAGMGTGKTAAAVWAADYLMRKGEVNRVLIISTKSTLNPAWADTIFGLVTDLCYTVLVGDRATRKKRAQTDTRYHIINHDGVGTIMPQLIQNRYDLIILDESTAYKNATTDRWKKVATLTANAPRLWLLTGSPTPKSPEDAYGQARLVCSSRVPKYYTQWRDMVMSQVSEYRYVPRTNSKEIVRQALQPAIYINKADVLKCRKHTAIVYREVDTTSEQNKALEQLIRKQVVAVNDKTVTPVHAASALTKYMQILLGAVYADDGTVAEVDSSPRIAEVIAAIEQGRNAGTGDWDAPRGRAIVAVPYRHVLDVYEKAISSAGYNVAVIHGGVAGKQRDNIVRKYQHTGEIDVLLCVPDAIAHGLTLTAANTFVWCSPLVKPEIFQQANERMDRPGQEQDMVQIRIYATPEEKQYYDVMSNREAWQNSLLSMYSNIFQ